MGKPHWASDWKVGVRVWVERDGESVLGEGRAELLAAIDREHSITKAAKVAGMSYRRAWNLIQAVNAAAGEPLVEAAVGGVKGGGAQLTPRGRLALEVYEQIRQTLMESAAGALHRTIESNPGSSATIHLAAAISLQEAVGQIVAEYALLRPTARVRTIFGASNELADLLLAGAPGNVFISAEPAELDRLEAAGLVHKSSRGTLAHNALAAIGSAQMKGIERPRDLLKRGIKRVALAEQSCPLGRHSQQYLESTGIFDELRPKVLHVDNSRAVLAAVVSGAADVGLAFSSDAARTGPWQTLFRVPAARFAATYEAGLIGPKESHAAAGPLLEFLSSPEARRCLRRCGFRPTKT